MKRFNTIFKTFLTILVVVPFSFIGTIAVGIAASNPVDVEATKVRKNFGGKELPDPSQDHRGGWSNNLLSGGRA